MVVNNDHHYVICNMKIGRMNHLSIKMVVMAEERKTIMVCLLLLTGGPNSYFRFLYLPTHFHHVHILPMRHTQFTKLYICFRVNQLIIGHFFFSELLSPIALYKGNIFRVTISEVGKHVIINISHSFFLNIKYSILTSNQYTNN